MQLGLLNVRFHQKNNQKNGLFDFKTLTYFELGLPPVFHTCHETSFNLGLFMYYDV